MKRLLKTFWAAVLCARICSACLCARTAHAATVTPNAASNYVFTAPMLPAHIRGEVMGDPPAYRTVRSEDADWMLEAFEERFALRDGSLPCPGTVLVPEFGTWALSETNRFHSWSTAVSAAGVTNIVVGYNLVTNSASTRFPSASPGDRYSSFGDLFWVIGLDNRHCSSSDYLDATAPTTTTARVAYDWGSPPVLTNVYDAVGYTNATTNAFSIIVLPMTNGTVSVHTNEWQFTYQDICAQPATNVRSAVCLDYCHAGVGMFPGYTNDIPNITSRIAFRPGSFAKTYAALRGAVRLAEQASTTNRAPPVVSYDHDINIYYPDGHEYYMTNSTGHVGAEYSIEGRKDVAYEWNSSTHEYDPFEKSYVSEDRTPAYYALAPSRFPSALVTTGGAVRVTVDAAFAVARFEYTKSERVYATQTSAGGWTNVVSVDKAVVVPVAGPTLLTGFRPDALVSVRLDAKALLAASASAAGVPAPPGNAEDYSPPLDEWHSWSVSCTELAIIYRLHPTSKFTDW